MMVSYHKHQTIHCIQPISHTFNLKIHLYIESENSQDYGHSNLVSRAQSQGYKHPNRRQNDKEKD